MAIQEHAVLPRPPRGSAVPPSAAAAGMDRLRRAIDHAAHLLPAQGPITVFIHHNTLHAFEDLPFTEAVEQGGRVFGCQPYLTEDRYRAELRRGRITFGDLEQVMRKELRERASDMAAPGCTRFDLRMAMLQYPLLEAPTQELLWFVAETDALRRVREDVSASVRERLVADTRRWVMRDLHGGATSCASPANSAPPIDFAGLFERLGEERIETWSDPVWEAFTLQALWRVCCDRVGRLAEPPASPPTARRHRDLLLEATGIDTDLRVHAILIRFCAAFLDQGVAHWRLPRREEGFFRAFTALYRQPLGPPTRWMRRLAAELTRLERERIEPLAALRESLDALGVAPEEWESYLSATLLPLRGWAGMARLLEERADRAVYPAPPGTLEGFLAVRLLLDRLAVEDTATEFLDYHGPLAALRDEPRLGRMARPAEAEQRAFAVFQLAQVFGWTPAFLLGWSDAAWAQLLREIAAFSDVARRRCFHLAYERRFRAQTLDALALHHQQIRSKPSAPRFQAILCLDEREESFRRHLEETAPDVETFGAAGFFAVPMYYRGAADAHFKPQCPIIMQPKHWVVERVLDGHEDIDRRRTRTRRALAAAVHRVHAGSRTFVVGALISVVGGVLAAGPLVARVLWPRLTARLRRALGRFVRTPPATRLRLERSAALPGPEAEHVGFTTAEMTDMAERALRDLGLTRGFARLVFVLGHGSSSWNNPHRSAYDCGACGGSPGAPNGRALARILNDADVRQRLAERGIVIPATTVAVGGIHNTCDDSLTYFDVDLLPATHRAEFEAARRDLGEAARRNAHERCRRFELAPLTMSPAEALEHVESRSEDLAQTRPELGHATNAICIVGRRERTRGLFFDRRAFLTSYDPTQDDADASILTRTLQAVFPVCGGINLEYYFSHVDNAGYGCGTKLPHNITALLGVMDGAASDLRTGLPWQMVEIHEPVRILFVLETRPEIVERIFERQPALGRLARNGWVQVATLDPESNAIDVYRNGAFHRYRPQAESLPRAASSLDWYRGWREHLEFAEIGQ